MTEDEIERVVEREFDRLDRRYMDGTLSEDEYHRLCEEIDDWAKAQLRRRERAS